MELNSYDINFYFQLILYHLENHPKLEFMAPLQGAIQSISNKVSSPILKSHFSQLAHLVTEDKKKTIQFIRAYTRENTTLQPSQELPIVIQTVIEVTLSNSQDNYNLTIKGFYSKEIEFVIGSTVLAVLCEQRKIEPQENELENQDAWACIKLKEASRCPSNVCVNYSGNLLRAGQFFVVRNDVVVVKKLSEQFVVLAVVGEGQENEFKAQERANCLIVKNGKISKTNPCFRDGFRILRSETGWTLWSNDEYCLMYLANPYKTQGLEDFDWVELPQGVFDVLINRVKYRISIKEC